MTGEDASLNNAHRSPLVISHLTRSRKALPSRGPGAMAGDAGSPSHPIPSHPIPSHPIPSRQLPGTAGHPSDALR